MALRKVVLTNIIPILSISSASIIASSTLSGLVAKKGQHLPVEIAARITYTTPLAGAAAGAFWGMMFGPFSTIVYAGTYNNVTYLVRIQEEEENARERREIDRYDRPIRKIIM